MIDVMTTIKGEYEDRPCLHRTASDIHKRMCDSAHGMGKYGHLHHH